MAQTKIKSRGTIRTGSAKIEIGDRLDKLVDIGACRGISVKETMSTTDIESDNAGVISTLVSEHKMEVSCDSLEISFSKYSAIRGGMDKYIEYDGKTEIERVYNVTNETYTRNEVIKIPYINADGTDIIISSVELENDGAKRTLTAVTDYEAIGTNSIKIISNEVIPSTDSLIINFKHTPNKMKRMSTGGGDSKIKPQWLVITNTNAAGQAFRIICPQASVSSGLELPFPSDKAQDVMVNKFTFTANISATENPYEQLAWIEDEQDVVKDEEVTAVNSKTVIEEKSIKPKPPLEGGK